MAWTVLYTVSTEGTLAMRCTSFHDAQKAHDDIKPKIEGMWGPDSDYRITCMVKGNHEIWLANEVRYV